MSEDRNPETFDYHIEGGLLFDGEGRQVDYRARLNEQDAETNRTRAAVVVTEPRIVSPEEAHGLARAMEPLPPIFGDLARTVATEAGRTRAAVVEALRNLAWARRESGDRVEATNLDSDANAIESGADW